MSIGTMCAAVMAEVTHAREQGQEIPESILHDELLRAAQVAREILARDYPHYRLEAIGAMLQLTAQAKQLEFDSELGKHHADIVESINYLAERGDKRDAAAMETVATA